MLHVTIPNEEPSLLCCWII